MTLAALLISPDDAHRITERFRAVTGRRDEIKGSRIDLGERAFLIELLAQTDARAMIGIALSATRPGPGEDRGLHDLHVYAALLDTVVQRLLPDLVDCPHVLIDDGRYGDGVMALIRADVAARLGTCGSANMALSHDADGLQLADVLANTFFTRALPGDRQARMAALVQPFIDAGRFEMQILSAEAQRNYEQRKEQQGGS